MTYPQHGNRFNRGKASGYFRRELFLKRQQRRLRQCQDDLLGPAEHVAVRCAQLQAHVGPTRGELLQGMLQENVDASATGASQVINQ